MISTRGLVCLISFAALLAPGLDPAALPAEAQGPRSYGVFVGVARHNATAPEKDLDYSDNSAYEASRRLGEWGWLDESWLLVTLDPDGKGGAIPESAVRGNASWENVREALDGLAQKVRPGDYFLFFFNGHSYGGGLRFSGDPQYPGTAVDYGALFDLLDRISARFSVLILDTCAPGSALEARANATGKYCLLGACSGGETSWQAAEWGMGYFTHSLLELYGRRDGNCTVTGDFDSLVWPMKNNTAYPQTPFASDPYPDTAVNFQTRLVRPSLGLDFSRDPAGNPVAYRATAPGDRKASFEVKLGLRNDGTAAARNISVHLLDSRGRLLADSLVPYLGWNSSCNVSIGIALGAGEGTGRMSASATTYYEGQNLTVLTPEGSGPEANVSAPANAGQVVLCGLLLAISGLVAMGYAAAVFVRDRWKRAAGRGKRPGDDEE